MNGKIEWEHDTEKGEIFDLEIEYSYVPYSPASLTSDPYYSEPEDGGYCEDVVYKVVGYCQYDENGDITQDLEKLTPEQSKDLTDKFNKMVFADLWLEERLHGLCVKNAEQEPDWD